MGTTRQRYAGMATAVSACPSVTYRLLLSSKHRKHRKYHKHRQGDAMIATPWGLAAGIVHDADFFRFVRDKGEGSGQQGGHALHDVAERTVRCRARADSYLAW